MLRRGQTDGQGGWLRMESIFDDAGTITYRLQEGGPVADWTTLPVIEERPATAEETELWQQHQVETVPDESVRHSLESLDLDRPVDLRTFLRAMNRIRNMWNNQHGTSITRRQMIDAIIGDTELRE